MMACLVEASQHKPLQSFRIGAQKLSEGISPQNVVEVRVIHKQIMTDITFKRIGTNFPIHVVLKVDVIPLFIEFRNISERERVFF